MYTADNYAHKALLSKPTLLKLKKTLNRSHKSLILLVRYTAKETPQNVAEPSSTTCLETESTSGHTDMQKV